jgi:hypothetical protein
MRKNYEVFMNKGAEPPPTGMTAKSSWARRSVFPTEPC